ncbi:MAG: glycosyltransferase [Coriobacteriales bacterium]|jgi:hypothetical protein|nr:glycosyltransferase [Coriobacteriales bacterium]
MTDTQLHRCDARAKGGVSVIIPTFKPTLYLDDAVRSVLNQDYDCWVEIVIVVNGSDYNYYKNLITQYVNINNITVLYTNTQTAGAARNYGVRQAKGEYLLFLDDDDWLAEGYVSKLVSHMEPDICLVCGGLSDYDGTNLNEDTLINRCIAENGTGRFVDYYALYPLFGNMTSKLYRRSFYLRNFAPFREDIKRSEDIVFWAENLSRLSGWVYLCLPSPHESYIRRVTSDSLSRPGPQSSIADLVAERVSVLTALWELSTRQDTPTLQREFIDRMIAFQWTLLISQYNSSSAEGVGAMLSEVERLPLSFFTSIRRPYWEHFVRNPQICETDSALTNAIPVGRYLFTRSHCAHLKHQIDNSFEVIYTHTGEKTCLQLFGGGTALGPRVAEAQASLVGVRSVRVRYSISSDIDGQLYLCLNEYGGNRALLNTQWRAMRVFADCVVPADFGFAVTDTAQSCSITMRLVFDTDAHLTFRDVSFVKLLGDPIVSAPLVPVSRCIWSRSPSTSISHGADNNCKVAYSHTEEPTFLQLFDGGTTSGPRVANISAALTGIRFVRVCFDVASDVDGQVYVCLNEYGDDCSLLNSQWRAVSSFAGSRTHADAVFAVSAGAEACNVMFKLVFDTDAQLELSELRFSKAFGDPIATAVLTPAAHDVWSRSPNAVVAHTADDCFSVEFTHTDDTTCLQLFSGGTVQSAAVIDTRVALDGAQFIRLCFDVDSDTDGQLLISLNEYGHDRSLINSQWRVVRIVADDCVHADIAVAVTSGATACNVMFKTVFATNARLEFRNFRFGKVLDRVPDGDVESGIIMIPAAQYVAPRSSNASVEYLSDDSFAVGYTNTGENTFLQLFDGGFASHPSERFMPAASLEGVERLSLSFDLESSLQGMIGIVITSVAGTSDDVTDGSTYLVHPGSNNLRFTTHTVGDHALFNLFIKLQFNEDAELRFDNFRIAKFPTRHDPDAVH